MELPELWSPDVEARVRESAHSLDAQETPNEVKFCKWCVVSNQRPRIVFDDEGVCSACRFAEHKREVDWGDRLNALVDLLDGHRRKGEYDVIVPCSGGKDSSTIAHKLKTEHGMSPLCVKWAPFQYTDIGWQNFQSFVHSGFDVATCFPNGHLHRKLARLAFEYLGDAWQPFAYGQLYYAMHMAVSFGIDLVMFGENGEAEYGGDPSANDRPCWGFEDWDKVYLKGASVRKLLDIGRDVGAITDEEFNSFSEFYDIPRVIEYSLTTPYLIEQQFHWWSYYNFWHPQGNYYHASENTGFTANSERSEGTYSKYASIDDRLDGFHYYMAFIKFGIGRCTSDAAHEIRDGEINREEGCALVRRYDGEFPKRYFEEFKAYLGLDDDQFWRVVDRYRRPHIWQKDGDQWYLRHTVHGNEPAWA